MHGRATYCLIILCTRKDLLQQFVILRNYLLHLTAAYFEVYVAEFLLITIKALTFTHFISYEDPDLN